MLQSNLPSDKRRPGVYSTFDDISGSRGLVPSTRRLGIIAAKHPTLGTATANIPVQVTDEAGADAAFGPGSEAALAVRQALRVYNSLGGASQIWVCPLADAAGVATVFNMTVTGAATAGGEVVFKISGRTLRATVANLATANTAALAIKAAVDSMASELGVVATLSTDTVVLTAVNTGVNGNEIVVELISTPPGILAPVSTATPGTGASSTITALANLLSKDYQALAVANSTATDITDLEAHMDEAWQAGKKRWRHAFMGARGSLASATTLADGSNRKEIAIGSIEGGENLPVEIAVSLAAMSLTQERPAYNHNNTVLPLYAPDQSVAYTDVEIETALAGGVTPFSVNEQGEVVMEMLVTTKTMEGGARFENLLELKHSKTVAYYAVQLDAVFSRMMQHALLDEDLIVELYQVAENLLRLGETLGDLHKVDEHLDELKLEPAQDNPQKLLVEFPQSVVPSLRQIDTTHRLFVEGAV